MADVKLVEEKRFLLYGRADPWLKKGKTDTNDAAVYADQRKRNKDCILFYRLGDFYEMFFDDALTASKELEITLTGKNCGLEERAPMCGVPYHAVDSYLK